MMRRAFLREVSKEVERAGAAVPAESLLSKMLGELLSGK